MILFHPQTLPARPLVLLGGGLDSTIALIALRQAAVPTDAIHFRYGQKADDRETEACIYFCTKYDVPLLDMPLSLDIIANSAIMRYRYSGKNKLEGRNAIFVMLAATYAATVGCDALVLGCHWGPRPAPFPDCTPEALAAMQLVLDTAYDEKIKVYAPFLHMRKEEIVAFGLPLDPDIEERTHTCYSDVVGGCGVCDHCRRKVRMFHSTISRMSDDELPGENG